jgi:hypothetical protein
MRLTLSKEAAKRPPGISFSSGRFLPLILQETAWRASSLGKTG